MDVIATTDRIPPSGQTIYGKEFHMAPGGKGANQAVQCARLGADVTMMGCVGDDIFANILLETPKASGVDISRVIVRKGCHSGVGHVTLETTEHTAQNRIVVIPGANLTLTREEVAWIRDEISTYDLVLLQLEIPLETVAYAAKAAKKLGKLVILDPAPAGTDLPQELFGNVDIVKPNEHEIMTLIGEEDITQQEAVSRLKEKGAASVLVTMGAAGSRYYGAGGEVIRANAIQVDSVDTTAAGDSYTAALAVAISEGAPMEQAMALASKVGAMVTTKRGAQTSIPSRSEVTAWNREA